MAEILHRGGIMMIPILISSALALAVAIERLYVLVFRTRSLDDETLTSVFELAENGDRARAATLVRDADSAVGELFIAVLEERDPEELENAAALSGSDLLFQFNKRLNILAVLGSVLPLMGLLGTVLGMIKVFSQVAHAGDAADITMLAGGIWEALITTAAGMAVAIPVVLVYHFFRRTVERIAHAMQQSISRLIQILKHGEAHG